VKKWIALGALVVTVAVVCIVYFRPIPFADAIPNDAGFFIVISDIDFQTRTVERAEYHFPFQADHPARGQIQQIIGKYTYRRTWRTLLRASPGFVPWGASVHINIIHPGYGLGTIHVYDTGHVWIGVNVPYVLEYKGNRAEQSLMQELRAFLEESEDIEPWIP
jgi:hypothetical protein